MALRLSYTSYSLKFKFDAGTSRGVLKEKPTWFIKIHDELTPEKFGLGECGPIEGLSPEDPTLMDMELKKLSNSIKSYKTQYNDEDIFKLANELVDPNYPSIQFGLETALLDLKNGGERVIFENDFHTGKSNIPINGLIWMGDESFMKSQKDEKLSKGFSCLKMKVAAIDLDKEIEILSEIRKVKSAEELILRVDANGGFKNNEVFRKLEALTGLELHSIEQPIMPRQPEAMSLIVQKSPIPIALDEDLIGHDTIQKKKELLDYIKPNFIVIKPTLVGGVKSTMDWIKLAEERNIGWWITSALESNIGLNAICQLTENYKPTVHQGLGTGQLYHNNIPSPLIVKDGYIEYDEKMSWDISSIEQSF